MMVNMSAPTTILDLLWKLADTRPIRLEPARG